MSEEPPRDPNLNPIIYGTEMEYAWNAFQTAFDAGKLAPDRTAFTTWWDSVACKVQWANVKELMQAAWGAGVQQRNIQSTAGFTAWWQEIVDKQPVVGSAPAP